MKEQDASADNKFSRQNKEMASRAAELVIANKELIFQNNEKEKRAAELVIANKELVFQNNEKEARAAELVILNNELAFQNTEREKRAAELIIANKELVYQNNEKEKRAAELAIANLALIFENSEKEKRALELITANKELESFTFISSHDLQEPLRKIQLFSGRLLSNDYQNLSESGKDFFVRIQSAALHMQTLINDLLAYSRTSATEKKFEIKHLGLIIEEVKERFQEELLQKNAMIEVQELCEARIITFQFQQMLQNLIGNSLKFLNPGKPLRIAIKSTHMTCVDSEMDFLTMGKAYCHITITDNGIGFEPRYKNQIFEIFQRLHSKKEYEGTGMGLTIVKKIVENHNGFITAKGELDKGATFDIYIPY
jgi:signal transduction histidine kinase